MTMKYELWYSVVVRDRQGKVVSRERRKSRSFLKQWNQLVYVQMAQPSYLTIKNTAGGDELVPGDTYNFRWYSQSEGQDFVAIVIGTDNTPVTVSDYSLGAKISEGGGAGQMHYLQCSPEVSQVSDQNCGFLSSNSMVNNSGADITVRESGIYVRMKTFTTYCCGVRDVFGTPQVVPNGGSITINYTTRVSV